jgi:hypothetical protein
MAVNETPETDNVVSLFGEESEYKPFETGVRDNTTSVENVLSHALESEDELESVLVFGLCKDGSLRGASSSDNMADILLLIKRVEKKFLEAFEDEWG